MKIPLCPPFSKGDHYSSLYKGRLGGIYDVEAALCGRPFEEPAGGLPYLVSCSYTMLYALCDFLIEELLTDE